MPSTFQKLIFPIKKTCLTWLFKYVSLNLSNQSLRTFFNIIQYLYVPVVEVFKSFTVPIGHGNPIIFIFLFSQPAFYYHYIILVQNYILNTLENKS